MINSIDAGEFCHKMNTPLSIIMLEMELMAYYVDDRAKLSKLIATAAQNSYRLARLVGNLMDILRIEAGELMTTLAEVDVVAFIREICACAESYANARSIRLVCETPQHEIVIPMDIEKLGKILFNLLSNAIKFTGDHGEIVVAMEETDGNGIRLSVADTGEGIPEDTRLQILGGSSRAGKTKGCGIGLTLVKDLVEILGGRIMVESEVGEGSEFTIELPLVRRADAPINVYGFNLAKKAQIELSDLEP